MRIIHSGILGLHDGFYWTQHAPSDNDIDADNDSVMNPIPNYLIDLSKIASNALGRQCSMTSAYKLHSVKIGIRPVDDAADNEEATIFGGRHLYRLATDHAKTAIQLARKTEKAHEASKTGSEGLFLTAHNKYSGFRYNWGNLPDDDVVEHRTTSTQLGSGFWSLQDICSLYDSMTDPDEENALFYGRAPGVAQSMWECGWSSRPFGDTTQGGLTHAGDCLRSMNIEILPLLAGNVLYSSGNEPGTVDDDYFVWVEVDFTIGGAF